MNNLILIINHKENDYSTIANIVNNVELKYDEIIIKVINYNELNFYSYKNQLNKKGLEYCELLANHIYRKVLFNFDVTNKEYLTQITESNIPNLFIDLYIEDSEEYYCIENIINETTNINKLFRIDLNLINTKTINIPTKIFKNIDFYYENIVDCPEIQDFNELEVDILEYIKNLNLTTIVKLQDYKYEHYFYGKSRYVKSSTEFEQLGCQKNSIKINQHLLKCIQKNEKCNNCFKIKSCISEDLFYNLNLTETCPRYEPK